MTSLARVRDGEKSLLILLLALTFLRGVLYISVVPPWQHYDEPTHFERLYWVAELGLSPAYSERSLSLPEEIFVSMCRFDFWGTDPCPDPPTPYKDAPSFRELGLLSQPLYYYLSAPFQLPLRHAPVEVQLYVGRLVSVTLYLLTVLIAYLLLRELFPEDREIRLAVPMLIAFIPAYTDGMSALNNDAGAVAIFSLLLWGIVRLIRRGLSLPSLAWVMGVAVLGFFTKRTAMVGALLAFVAIPLGRRTLGWRIWAIGGAIALALIISCFSWSGSASWYEMGPPSSEPTRVLLNGPVGRYALYSRYLVQELAPAQVKGLQGQVVTLGGWIRAASSSVTVHAPSLYDGINFHRQVVTATPEWQFHAMTITVSSDATTIQVRLLPYEGEAEGTGAAYFDGVVLAEGQFPLDEAPQFEDPYGRRGTWGGQPFVNLVSNGSAERAWPRLRPWLAGLISKSQLLWGRDPNLFFQSILDWQRTGRVYRPVLINLFESFWARFGWNDVKLAAGWYWVLFVPTILGLAGAMLFFVRHVILSHHYHPWQRRALTLLTVAFFLVWGIAMLSYSHPILATSPRIHIAVARYGYPAIIPTVTFLFLGWRELTPARWRRFLPVISLLAVALLDALSLLGTIIPYYYVR